MRWLDGIINSMDMNLSKLWETVKDRKNGKTDHDHYCSSISGLSDRKNDEAYWMKVLISCSTHCQEERSPAA